MSNPSHPPAANSNGFGRRPPFPHSVEVSFDPSGANLPSLVFNFTHSARTALGDAIKAEAFHTSTPIPTFYDNSANGNAKVVHIPYPYGLKRVYFARAGNAGLEFETEASLKAFQDGILGVGHVMIKPEMGLFRVYLGDKVREVDMGSGCAIHMPRTREPRGAAAGGRQNADSSGDSVSPS